MMVSMHGETRDEHGGRGARIAPSILSADFGALADGVRRAESMGGDFVHIDVMDGCFVPPITFGAKAVADLRPVSRLPFDVHLMICRPENHVDSFCASGADYLTVHQEASTHLHGLLGAIAAKGKKPGVAIVPSTPVEAVVEVLALAALVLVMTVNPGFGGQEMIARCLRKVEALRRIRQEEGMDFLIEVDGGINRVTAADAVGAGADVLVAGSALFGAVSAAAEVAFMRGR
jgi:ribulose-phosphate 3-epimerase